MPVSDPDDLVQPFQIDRFGLRGRVVRLGGVVNTILSRHGYPDAVSVLLGELLTIAPALSAALKFDGVFSLQISGDGPVRSMVVDCTTAGGLRAYAGYDRDRLAEALSHGAATVPTLLGRGHLALTVDQGPDTERYQGIVDLAGDSLADCIHRYFQQSEQIGASLKVAVQRRQRADGSRAWRSGCIMVQNLPGGTAVAETAEAVEDAWQRARLLMDTATADELTDPDLSAPVLLNRLFSEDGVWVYSPFEVDAQCRCSEERVLSVLRSFAAEERAGMVVDGRIFVTCEFCNARYVFAPDQIAD